MSDRVAVCLADGFEEIEAVGIIDVLRRAGVRVLAAAVDGGRTVRGAHDLRMVADCVIEELPVDELALVALPGGMPGSVNLAESEAVRRLLRTVHGGGKHVAAVCAAPLALQAAGLLDGRRVTAYPAVQEQLTGCTYTGSAVECDGRIITGKGPGVVLDFALQLVATLCGVEKAEELKNAMQMPLWSRAD